MDGALLYVSGGTGITAQHVTITYVSTTVVLLSASIGGDATDVATSDGPWATVEYAVDNTAAATDELRLYGTFTPTAKITQGDALLGNAGDPARIRGCNAYGIVDGSLAVVSAASLGATTDLWEIFPSTYGVGHVVVFQYIDFYGNSGGRDFLYTAWNPWGVVIFSHCTFRDAGRHILYVSSGANISTCSFNDCEIKDGANDVISDSGQDFATNWLRCSVHDNTGDGIRFCAFDQRGGSATCEENTVYDNAGVGIILVESSPSATSHTGRVILMRHNTVDNNTGNGGEIATGTDLNGLLVLESNVFSNNGGYGFDTNGDGSAIALACANCFPSGSSANTSGDTDAGDVQSDGTIAGLTVSYLNFSDEPGFVSTTDGSEDYTPDTGSALIGAALTGPTA